MTAKKLVDGLYRIPGLANTYLIDAPEGLALIDTGFPKGSEKIFAAMRQLGRAPGDLRHIILTHAHFDHIGSLAAIARETGARTYMHQLDAPIAERGAGFRPLKQPAPGLLPSLLFKVFARRNPTVEPCRIDQTITDGEVLPIAGGLKVIHVPGHCAGQIALLWASQRVLFTGDACTNIFGLGPPIGYEDQAEGERSQRKLTGLDFEIACFGHGPPLLHDAATKFRARWNGAR
jgi:glyoxylase-like metal-dependent hydrolase (beta-lactamase superfamily II)